MPAYGFKCDLCGHQEDVIMSMSEYASEISCCRPPEQGSACTGNMHRDFSSSAPSIGKVSGAGGSPFRASSR